MGISVKEVYKDLGQYDKPRRRRLESQLSSASSQTDHEGRKSSSELNSPKLSRKGSKKSLLDGVTVGVDKMKSPTVKI